MSQRELIQSVLSSQVGSVSTSPSVLNKILSKASNVSDKDIMKVVSKVGLSGNAVDMIKNKLQDGSLNGDTVLSLFKQGLSSDSLQKAIETFDESQLRAILSNHPMCLKAMDTFKTSGQPDWEELKSCLFSINGKETIEEEELELPEGLPEGDGEDWYSDNDVEEDWYSDVQKESGTFRPQSSSSRRKNPRRKRSKSRSRSSSRSKSTSRSRSREAGTTDMNFGTPLIDFTYETDVGF